MLHKATRNHKIPTTPNIHFTASDLYMKYTSTRSLLKAVYFSSLLLFIFGCATPPEPINRETAARIHRVAVISVTAQTFARKYTGFTAFGNEKDEINISDWNIDGKYEEQITAEVSKLPGVTVVKAPYSLAEFSHANDLNGPWEAPAFFGPNWSAIEGATRSYCAANSLDGVLVLAKSTTNDFLAGTNQFFGGAGIYVRGPGNRISVMHLISDMSLLDCATAKPIAVRTLASNQNGRPSEILRSAPMLHLSSDISRLPISRWSEIQRKQIEADLISLPAKAWGTTLRSIFPTAQINANK